MCSTICLTGKNAYNPGEVGAGDGVCDFVDPGESILGFLLVGTSSDRSRTSLSRLRLLLSESFFVELELELPLLRGAAEIV